MDKKNEENNITRMEFMGILGIVSMSLTAIGYGDPTMPRLTPLVFYWGITAIVAIDTYLRHLIKEAKDKRG